MDLEYGEAQRGILTLVSGKTVRLTDMEYILGSMATDIKASSGSVSNMERELKSLPMATLIAELMKTVNPMVTVNTFGVTAVHTRVNSKTVSETAKEFGRNPVIPTLIHTMVSSSTKRSKVMESLHGQTGANTWEISQTMSAKATAKCTGATETYTKANGTMEPKSRKSHNPPT